MPHRRHWHSRRKFKDGVYQLLSSHLSETACLDAIADYYAETDVKLRYLKGEDGKYHIYEKVEES